MPAAISVSIADPATAPSDAATASGQGTIAPQPPSPPEPDRNVSDPSLPQDGPIRPDDKVPAGQGLLEVVAGPRETVSLDGAVIGTGPLGTTPVGSAEQSLRSPRWHQRKRAHAPRMGQGRPPDARPTVYSVSPGAIGRRMTYTGRAGRPIAVLTTTLAVHCTTPEQPPPTGAASPTATSAPAAAASPPTPQETVLVDVVRDLPSCDVNHHGAFLDMGTDLLLGRYGWTRGSPAGVFNVEHDGLDWARTTDRRLDVQFTLLDPTPVFVAARVHAYAANAAAVAIDDQPLGTLVFHRDQTHIATSPTTTLPIDSRPSYPHGPFLRTPTRIRRVRRHRLDSRWNPRNHGDNLRPPDGPRPARAGGRPTEGSPPRHRPSRA